MSNKGKKFTRDDLPAITRQRLNNGQVSEAETQRLSQWLADQTERHKVVAVADDGTEIIAEELAERAMRHFAHDGQALDPQVLAALRGMMSLTPTQRCGVLDAFDDDAELRNPFKAPEPEPKREPPKKGKK